MGILSIVTKKSVWFSVEYFPYKCIKVQTHEWRPYRSGLGQQLPLVTDSFGGKWFDL